VVVDYHVRGTCLDQAISVDANVRSATDLVCPLLHQCAAPTKRSIYVSGLSELFPQLPAKHVCECSTQTHNE
jgi:hypothetical protein